MKDKNSHALAIMPAMITILIIMFYISELSGIAQGQNNNDKFSSFSSPITTNNTINTQTKITHSTTNSISLLLAKGYVDRNIAFFVATDASDKGTAASITKNPGFKVNFAPALAFVPESARQQGYQFINGVRGEISFGFQLPVASAVPGDKNYSPLVQMNFVKWNSNNNNNSSTPTMVARELKSVNDIMTAQKNNELTIAKTNIVINSPAVRDPR
jgi:hypothetical protein